LFTNIKINIMPNNPRGQSNQQSQHVLPKKVTKVSGFSVPQTVEEVIEFERIYGRTDFILPDELQDLEFHYDKKSNSFNVTKVKLNDNFAMAAREGTRVLPMKIKKQIMLDIEKVQAKKKQKSK